MIHGIVEQRAADQPDLLTRARSGDLTAFESILRQHERVVLRLAHRLTGHLEDAQEIAQDVFLKLHRELTHFSDLPHVGAWLYRVTVNSCWDHGRKLARSRLVPLDDLPFARDPKAPNPETAAVLSRDLDLLRAALLELGPRERAALVLREMEGLETSEVAAAMGLAESTVRAQIAVARVKLRKSIETARRRRP